MFNYYVSPCITKLGAEALRDRAYDLLDQRLHGGRRNARVRAAWPARGSVARAKSGDSFAGDCDARNVSCRGVLVLIGYTQLGNLRAISDREEVPEVQKHVVRVGGGDFLDQQLDATRKRWLLRVCLICSNTYIGYDCRNQSALDRLSRLGLMSDSRWRPLIGWNASIRQAVERMEHEQREQVCLATT